MPNFLHFYPIKDPDIEIFKITHQTYLLSLDSYKFVLTNSGVLRVMSHAQMVNFIFVRAWPGLTIGIGSHTAIEQCAT